MRAKETQAALAEILVTMMEADHVKSEWSVRSDATDDVYDKASYAPRLDLAVGPFNVSSEREVNVKAIIRYQRHPLIAALRREVIRQNHGDPTSTGTRDAYSRSNWNTALPLSTFLAGLRMRAYSAISEL